MAYSADSFTALEVPTLAKMNKLWSNDASFNDGTGIASSAITSAKIAQNAVTGDKLGVNAVFLGKTTITSTVNLNTSYADLISLTVTVPAGGRSILLLLSFAQAQGSAGTERAELRFMESSTIFQRYYTGFKNPGIGGTMDAIVTAPSAGSHTYVFNGKMDIGTVGLFYADATGSKFELQAFLI